MSSEIPKPARAAFAVPDNWRQHRLGEIFRIATDGITASDLADLPKVHHYSLPAFDAGARPEICSGDTIKSNKSVVPENCVLFSKLNPRIPRIWRIAQRQSPYSYCSTEFWPVVPRTKGADLDFLAHYLRSEEFLKHPAISPSSSTNSHQRVDRKAFEAFIISLPPLDEQKRIAVVLQSVDKVVSATKRVLKALKSAKQGTLSDIFVQENLPKGWTLTALGELGAKGKHAIVDGPFGSNLKSEHYRASGIPVFQSGFVTSAQFKPTKYVYVDQDLFTKQIRSRAVAGDILMAKIGAQAGRCAVIPHDHPEGILAGNCLKITPDTSRCSAVYLQNVLTFMYSITGLREIIAVTAQPAISLARLKTLLVPLPPLREQAALLESIEGLDRAIETQASNLGALQELRSSLSTDLLSGHVRVHA